MRFLACAAVMCAGSILWAAELPVDDGQSSLDKKAQQKKPTPENRQKAAEALAPKIQEVKALQEKAGEITAKIGTLASSGKLKATDEGVKALQDLVQELAKINEQLKKMQEEIEGIKGWIEGQNEALPVMQGDLDNLKRVSWGNYFQFQWADTQEGFQRRLGDNSVTGRTNSDAFQLRRVRLSTTNRIDPKTSVKASVDLATGGNRLGAELKDAILRYDIVPSDVSVGIEGMAGQMPMPLGYELERSSSEREMPERTIYNRILMAGERNRGIAVKYGTSANSYFHAGIWNSLTVTDPQLNLAATFRNLNGTQVGAHAGARIEGKNYDAGISAFVAERPRFAYTDFVSAASNSTTTVVADGGRRHFVYLDGAYVGLIDPKLTLRGEVMMGRDRVPTLGTKRQTVAGSSATIANFPEFVEFTNVLGYHIMATYNLDYRNILAARWEYFDPDTSSGGNDQTGLSFSFIHYMNPGARLMIAHDMFKERAFELRNNVTTIRLQFRL